MKSTVQIGFIILVFGISLIYQNHILLSCLTAIAIGFNIYFFIIDRKELRDAIYYIRPEMNKTNFWTETRTFLLLMIVGISAYYLLISIPEEIKTIVEKTTGLYVCIIMFSTFPANYYQPFKASIRTFNSGLIIPKDDNSIINWKAIKSIELMENSLIIKFYEKSDFTFNFDKRDINDAVKIKNQFEQNTYNK